MKPTYVILVSVCLALIVWFPLGDTWGEEMKAFRVCADPFNFPFSNQNLEGFENKIAALLAQEFGATVTYTWQPQRRGFVRGTLKAKRCDVVIGVPTGYQMVLWTKPYYRSTFVIVSRKDRGIRISSLDDASLQQMRIGVPQNSPADILLGHRGIVKNVVGYSIWYDGEERYAHKILEDVMAGQIDVAIVWGPSAGYFVQQQSTELTMTPIAIPRPGDTSEESAVYTISMGVRESDESLKARLEGVLSKKQSEIHQILRSYGVPLLADQKS